MKRLGVRPPRSRKRTLVKLTLLLVGGAIINVAVAWGCTLLLAEKSDGWSDMRATATRFENGNTWGAWRLDRPGYFRIESHVGGPINDWDDRYEHPRTVSESWGRVPPQDEANTQWVEEASGWPYVWLWSRTTLRDPLHNVVGFDARVLPRDGVEGGFVIWQSVLPTKPRWPGFAINTIFYAGVLWLLFTAPGFVRRRVRVMRHHCPACAYPIGTNPRCTECGTKLPSPSRLQRSNELQREA